MHPSNHDTQFWGTVLGTLYTGGIITSEACGTTLDHGVLVVGYGVDDDTKYWIVKNSWSASWGENGYVRIERSDSENDKGIYDAMNFGVRCCISSSVLFLNCGDKIIVSPDHFCQSLHMYANENGNTSDVVCFPLNQIANTFVKTMNLCSKNHDCKFSDNTCIHFQT